MQLGHVPLRCNHCFTHSLCPIGIRHNVHIKHVSFTLFLQTMQSMQMDGVTSMISNEFNATKQEQIHCISSLLSSIYYFI
jgi:hypothetical protein